MGWRRSLTRSRKKQDKPVLIVLRTIIGKGSPHKAGTSKAHGSPLGAEEVAETKEALGFPKEEFLCPSIGPTFFEQKLPKEAAMEAEWNELFKSWAAPIPNWPPNFRKCKTTIFPPDLEETLEENRDQIARSRGRAASQMLVCKRSAKCCRSSIGGSADLSCSDLTMMKDFPIVTPGTFSGAQYQIWSSGIWDGDHCQRPLPDRDVPALLRHLFHLFRLHAQFDPPGCLSPYHVIYQFTHDSIFLGEDGPTHQPIEHLASLCAHAPSPCDPPCRFP